MSLWSDKMEVLNILSDHLILFSVLIGILVINFSCIIYLVIKERKEDKEEIERLLGDTTKIEIIQDSKTEQNKKEVEDMLEKMQQDLEEKNEDIVSNFEEEQEENSIISYQELLKSVKGEDNSSKKIVSVEKINKEFDDDKTLLIPLEEVEDKKDKFKKSVFISPIFGKQDNDIKYPSVPKKIENGEIKNIDPSEIEINKDIDVKEVNDFLNALKDFRKNLN